MKKTRYSKITKIDDILLDSIGIYKLTSPSNKIYIGSTINSFRNRFNHHFNDYSNNPIKRAIKKYGRENFKYEILESYIIGSKEEFFIRNRETYWISQFNCLTKMGGYNILPEGDMICRRDGIPVIQFDLNGNIIETFNKIIDAINKTGASAATIRKSSSYNEGERQYISNRKYKWLYKKDYDNGKRISPLIKSKRRGNRRSINQYTRSMDFITNWRCSADIKDTLGYDMANIHNCCKSKLKSYKNYIWKYE